MRKEQGNAYQGVAPVMGSGINDTAVALAADDGSDFFHLRHDIDFTHGGSLVTLSAGAGNIAQRPRRTQIGDRAAGRMVQHIIGYGDQRIFLAEHIAVLANNRQPIDIGVDHESHVGFARFHQVGNFGKVLRQRFGIVREKSVGRAVELHDFFHAQRFEQRRNGDAADRIDAIDRHAETGGAYGIDIDQIERQHIFDMPARKRVVAPYVPQMFDIGKVEIFGFGDAQHFVALCRIQKLAPLVQEFERIPLFRIMACSKDYAAASLLHRYRQLGGRRRGKTYIDNVEAHAHERTHHAAGYHFARHAGIATHHDFRRRIFRRPAYKGGIRRRKLHNIQRIESFTGTTADRAPYSRYGFYQCHFSISFLSGYILS